MALLRRSSPMGRSAPGILPNRQQAHPALLRMLSRARRRRGTLLLVRIAPHPEAGGADERGFQRFLEELAAELRINDLAWWEPGAVVMVLCEDAEGDAAVVERLERRAVIAGARPRWRTARFPQQGLTLQALLEEVQWVAP